jgi:hypothetical protein
MQRSLRGYNYLMLDFWLIFIGALMCAYAFWDAHEREARTHHHDALHGYRLWHLFGVLIGLCLVVNGTLASIGQFLIIDVSAVRGLLFLGVGTAMAALGFISLYFREAADALFSLVARDKHVGRDRSALGYMLLIIGLASVFAFFVFYSRYVLSF